MTIIGLEAKIDELEKQLEISKQQLARLKENFINGDPCGLWKPQVGERYYVISADGNIISFNYVGEIDENFLAIGNCFKTLAEAEFMEKRLKVIASLHKWSESRDRYWGEGTGHYYLTYDYFSDQINIVLTTRVDVGAIYFGSEEYAKKAIQEVGEKN